MTAPHVVRADACPVQPWKNGGGTTRELLRLPATGADWWLRVSVADIAQDGPFSAFPGTLRGFAVLTGAGVALDWPASAQAPARRSLHGSADPALLFDGALAPGCILRGGPTRDLNVMLRGAAATQPDALALVPLAAGEPITAAPLQGIFARVPVSLEIGRARLDLPAFALAWRAAGDLHGWTLAAAQDAQDGPPAWRIDVHPLARGAAGAEAA